MKMKVEIISTAVETFSGISEKNNNKPYEITKQKAWLFTVGPYPTEFELMLKKGQTPYAPGIYTLASDSIRVDRNRRLTVEPKLIPEAAAAPVSSVAKQA